MEMKQSIVTLCLFAALLGPCLAKKPKEKPDWAKKDITDYTDADMERLLDQWEEDEEPLEPDELPEHLRPQPKIDMNNLQGIDPENLQKMVKKGQTVMSFIVVDGDPDRDRTEQLTKLWQGSLHNSHIQAERFVIEDNRVIFMYKDGSQAWDGKDFLVQQPECKEVMIEGKTYYGKHTKQEESKTRKEEL